MFDLTESSCDLAIICKRLRKMEGKYYPQSDPADSSPSKVETSFFETIAASLELKDSFKFLHK